MARFTAMPAKPQAPQPAAPARLPAVAAPANPADGGPDRARSTGASKAAPAAVRPPGRVVGSAHGRVRLGMYLAFALLALALGLHGWNTLRLESLRRADADLLDLTAMQRAFSQQAGRLAALIAMRAEDPAAVRDHLQTLSDLMARSLADALAMDALLAQQMQRSTGPQQPFDTALATWQTVRERLWYRTGLLLRDGGDDIPPDVLRRRAAALQGETEPALQAAQRLSATVRGAAEQRADAWDRQVRRGLGGMLLLLALLCLAVVEPTARSVRRHARRLDEQAAELRRLALVAEHTSTSVLISDCNDTVLWVNAAYTSASGMTLNESLGRSVGTLLPNTHADRAVVAQLRQALRHGHGLRHEWLHRTRSGHALWLDVDLRPLRGPDGMLEGFVRVCTDISARVQQQAKLQALWAALPTGVVVRSLDGELVDANPAAARLLGLTQQQLLGSEPADPHWQIVHADGSPCPRHEYPDLLTLASGQALSNQTRGVQTGDGQLRWLLVNTQPQRDGSGQISGVVSCFNDITEQRQLQGRLHDSARTDALTQLPNRTVVTERLQRAIDHARRHPGYGFAVLFMDFDRFKQVNDTLGHSAGDELLRQIARRLSLSLRPGDAVARLQAPAPADAHAQMAARLGGDEFVVVLEGVNDAATVAVIAQRLLQELAEPYLIGSTPVQSSASMGVVLVHGAGMDADAGTAAVANAASIASATDTADAASTADEAETVLRNADTAMYEAKRAGRGRWVMFDDSMHERVVRALAVETDLRRALKEDELFVVYQPVVNLASRRMVAVEALVRWAHPVRGLVSPVDFIGVAEECGLIDAVGSLVLHKACAQFMQWRRTLGAAAPQHIAVNLSRAQLERAGLVDDVRRALHACGMRPGQLQLEVTESLAAQGDGVQARLRELKQLGVKLALDDFGTGYSSLACLHQLPVDTVKIDRSFVQHAETVEYHRVLIEATIRVARTLGMTTVAEGIETAGQADLMRALDCDLGQGYLYSRPLDAAQLQAWARAQAPALADSRPALAGVV